MGGGAVPGTGQAMLRGHGRRRGGVRCRMGMGGGGWADASIRTASTSYARASSVGAVYCPSGHHDWSRKPARKVKAPLRKGRLPWADGERHARGMARERHGQRHGQRHVDAAHGTPEAWRSTRAGGGGTQDGGAVGSETVRVEGASVRTDGPSPSSNVRNPK